MPFRGGFISSALPLMPELHAGVIFDDDVTCAWTTVAVDIDRPCRIFGLSKLALHAADGSETTLTLEYLKETDAEQLRREIRICIGRPR